MQAHYACDCWDAELLTSAGWVECVGCADRSAYDLAVHSKQTGKPLIVREMLEQPRQITEWEVEINKKQFGPTYKKNGKTVEKYVCMLTLAGLSHNTPTSPYFDCPQRPNAIDANNVGSALLSTTQEQREGLAKELKDAGKITLDVPELGKVEVSRDLLTIEHKTRIENVREYIPNVIEPSFGIGRIFFALCEHNFWTRADDGGDEARGVSLPFELTRCP